MPLIQHLPNILSASRGAAAAAILAVQPFGAAFWALYCWAGISDMLDGPIARKLNVCSKKGEIIDSIADAMFIAASAIKILPNADLPIWIWVWSAGIGTIKIVNYIVRRPKNIHNNLNRLTGALLFAYPFFNTTIAATLVCIAASCALVGELKTRQEEA